MAICRVNDCERDGICQFICRDCGTIYPSDERECPNCFLRSANQYQDEGCGYNALHIRQIKPRETFTPIAEIKPPS